MSELRKIREQVEQKYNELRKELQDSCNHEEISEWIEEWWAPGHTTGYLVKECSRCGMEMERKSGWIDDDTVEGKLISKSFLEAFNAEEVDKGNKK